MTLVAPHLNPVVALLGRRLRLAVIGGGPGSFIGPMHRQAARLDVRDGVAALALFKSNSLAGLLLVIAMTAGMWDGPASAL